MCVYMLSMPQRSTFSLPAYICKLILGILASLYICNKYKLSIYMLVTSARTQSYISFYLYSSSPPPQDLRGEAAQSLCVCGPLREGVPSM